MHLMNTTQKWFKGYRLLAEKWQKQYHEFLTYKPEVMDRIERLYNEREKDFEVIVYGTNYQGAKNIDHHKRVALLIQLFLENSIFKLLPNRPNTTVRLNLINEFFCLLVLRSVVLQAINYKIDFDEFRRNYEEEFYLLLIAYKEQYNKCNNDSKLLVAHFFAHVVYFVERCFFCKSK